MIMTFVAAVGGGGGGRSGRGIAELSSLSDAVRAMEAARAAHSGGVCTMAPQPAEWALSGPQPMRTRRERLLRCTGRTAATCVRHEGHGLRMATASAGCPGRRRPEGRIGVGHSGRSRWAWMAKRCVRRRACVRASVREQENWAVGCSLEGWAVTSSESDRTA